MWIVKLVLIFPTAENKSIEYFELSIIIFICNYSFLREKIMMREVMIQNIIYLK